jgi:murein DD-endopeptidase MepM/ murein hydrolase activator NlpD
MIFIGIILIMLGRRPLLVPAPGKKPPSSTPLFMVFAGLAVAALVIIIFLRHPKRKTRFSPEKPPPEFTRKSYNIQPGEILPFLFNRAGVPPPIADSTISALRKFGFNFRLLHPGDSLILYYRSDTLFKLQYWRNYDTIYQIEIDSSPYRLSLLTQDVQLITTLIRGEIKTSLYQTLLDLGEKPGLVAAYTEIFDWEIDFFSETQPGDSFIILVPKKYVAAQFVGYAPIIAARYKGLTGNFFAFRYTDPEGKTDYYNREGLSMRKTFLKSPLRFSRISSFFGRRRHPIRRIPAQHQGIDYAAPKGTPVCCVADGRVISAGWSGGYGRLIRIGHRDGYETRYGHLTGLGKGIKSGAPVTQGQIIGYVGSTGLSTGPHLHYEVRKFGTPVNPLRLNPPRAGAIRLAYLPIFQSLRDSLSPYLLGQKQLPAPNP